MTRDRDRNGRRGGKNGNPSDMGAGKEGLPPGYWDEREASQAEEAYRAAFQHRPHNYEAEAALLGALMIDNRLVETVRQQLEPKHFFEPMHARVYERILSLVARDKLATPITLKPYFEGETFVFDEEGKPDEGINYLAQLTGSGAGLIGARQFAKQIVELAWNREIIATARAIAESAKSTAEEINPRGILQEAEASMFELSNYVPDVSNKHSASFSTAWDEVVDEIEQTAAGKPIAGILIDGYDDWNQVCGRMEDGDLIYLGGRPSMGKTAVACAVAVGAAAAGNGTEFISLEMTRRKVTRRMLANVIFDQGKTSSYSALSAGRITRDDRAAIAAAREAIDAYPLHIHDPTSMLVEELQGYVQRRKRLWAAQGKDLKLVVVDYLDLFGTRQVFRSEQERVSYLSRIVKQVAKTTGVPLIVLVQLSRGVESREDKHPLLSDLRQSGSLEADADVVMFVYRDEYYLLRSKPKESDEKKYAAWQDELIASRDRLEIYAAKMREGALTKRTGYFFADAQAIRSSDFYRSDLFRSGGDGFSFGDGAAGAGFGQE